MRVFTEFLITMRNQYLMARSLCYIILTATLTIGITLNACTGPAGPQGLEGAQGSQGEQGPVGPAGVNGSVIYAGEGEPDKALGISGDYYLDLLTGNLYGPKTNDGWGNPIFNLTGPQGPPGEDGADGEPGPQGPQGPPGDDGQDGEDGKDGSDGKDGQDGEDGEDGEDGKDGSQIFAANGTPGENIGNEGDFYLDTNAYDLYGPKTENGWGNPVNLQKPVMYSEWMQLGIEATASDTTVHGRDYTKYDFSASALTQEIIDTGAILVYSRYEGLMTQLPYTIASGTSPYSVKFTAFQPGVLTILVQRLSNLAAGLEPDTYFRYILIPGGIPVGKISTDFWQDYETVAEHYGIPE